MQGKKCKWENEASTIKKKVILFMYQKFHLWGREEVNTRFCWGNQRERDHLEELGTDGWVVLRWIFRKCDGGGGGKGGY